MAAQLEVFELVPGYCRNCPIIKSFANGIPTCPPKFEGVSNATVIVDGESKPAEVVSWFANIVLGCAVSRPSVFGRWLLGKKSELQVVRTVVFLPDTFIVTGGLQNKQNLGEINAPRFV